MVLDSADGSVYFCFRDADDTAKSGIMRWNPATNALETIVSGVNAYGIALNDELTNLF